MLAYLVHNTLSAREELYIKEEDCPITRFLIEREWQDSEAMKWHHQLHEGVFDPQVAQQLLQWMAQQYQQKKTGGRLVATSLFYDKSRKLS